MVVPAWLWRAEPFHRPDTVMDCLHEQKYIPVLFSNYTIVGCFTAAAKISLLFW